jgi:hypothetical protein
MDLENFTIRGLMETPYGERHWKWYMEDVYVEDQYPIINCLLNPYGGKKAIYQKDIFAHAMNFGSLHVYN